MNFKSLICILVFLFIGLSCSLEDKKSVNGLYKHSHNDYKHEHPLYDAIKQNFRSIEADIYRIGDSLFIAHDFDEIKPGRTLRNLYLDPLEDQIVKNGGSVYGDDEEVILFVDIKANGIESYQLLHQILEEYKSILSVFKNGTKIKNSVTVVVSGNRPFELMKEQVIRFAGYDGRLNDLNAGISSKLMPVVSDDWTKYFDWDGSEEMPQLEKEKLKNYVLKAHEKGYLIRFWATPNQSARHRHAVWTELMNANVDFIGSDDLQELNEFVLKF